MSIRLDASFCAKKLTVSGEKLTVFIIQQTLFFQWKSSLCLRPFPWRRCRRRDRGLAGWRASRGIDQSETSFHAVLTSLLKRKEPLVHRRTLQLQSDGRYFVITWISSLKSRICMIFHQLRVTRSCILRCGLKKQLNPATEILLGGVTVPVRIGMSSIDEVSEIIWRWLANLNYTTPSGIPHWKGSRLAF